MVVYDTDYWFNLDAGKEEPSLTQYRVTSSLPREAKIISWTIFLLQQRQWKTKIYDYRTSNLGVTLHFLVYDPSQKQRGFALEKGKQLIGSWIGAPFPPYSTPLDE